MLEMNRPDKNHTLMILIRHFALDGDIYVIKIEIKAFHIMELYNISLCRSIIFHNFAADM